METKDKEQNENRFSYSNDDGLAILSKEEYLSLFDKKKQSLLVVADAFKKGLLSEDILFKAISKYGESKHTEKIKVTRKDGTTYYREQSVGGGIVDKETESKQYTDKELQDLAKETPETTLQNAIKQSKDEEVRNAAKEELTRRNDKKEPEKDETESEIRQKIKDIAAELDPISDKLDNEYKDLSFFERVRKKKENPKFSELSSLQQSYRDKLNEVISNKPKEKKEEDLLKESKKNENLKKDIKEASEDQLRKFNIIQASNPMLDDYHVGIRSPKDIKTFNETLKDEESFTWGDFSLEDAKNALKTGEITVYSSKKMNQGDFVSTSKIQAQQYAGRGNITEKKVKLNDIAWINGDEGQIAVSK